MKVKICGNSTDSFSKEKEYEVFSYYPKEGKDLCDSAYIIADDGEEAYVLIHEFGTCAHLDSQSKWAIVGGFSE